VEARRARPSFLNKLILLHIDCRKSLGHVTAVLVMSPMNGSIHFKGTIDQTTETMPLALKQ